MRGKGKKRGGGGGEKADLENKKRDLTLKTDQTT